MRVLITGANRGIGLELVRQYALRDDVTVFAACRRTSDELEALASDRVIIVPLDVTDAESIQQSVNCVMGHLDVLINNAGINRPNQALSVIQPETMLEIFNVNTVAPLMVTRAYLDLLKKSENPRLVNISSSMGSLDDRTYGGSYAYSTSKAALNMVTRGLAADLRSTGITVLTLDPGWVQTDMGGDGAPLTPPESALGIIKVIDGLTAKDSGTFLRWDGSVHAW